MSSTKNMFYIQVLHLKKVDGNGKIIINTFFFFFLNNLFDVAFAFELADVTGDESAVCRQVSI